MRFIKLAITAALIGGTLGLTGLSAQADPNRQSDPTLRHDDQARRDQVRRDDGPRQDAPGYRPGDRDRQVRGDDHMRRDDRGHGRRDDWGNRGRGWHHGRHCRIVWHHHHRIRVCR